MLSTGPVAAGTYPQPRHAEHHAPRASLIFRTLVPKLMLCSPAQATAVRPHSDHGKLRGASPTTEDDVAARCLPRRQEFENLVHHAPPGAVAVLGRVDPNVWVGYAEFEARRRCIADARRVWERALAEMPSSDRLWRGYAQMEEAHGNYPGARQVFERWMEWRPGLKGWLAYAEFERRNGEVRRARAVYERLVRCRRGDAGAWVGFAEFEARNEGVERTRACYERAMEAVVEGGGGDGAEELVNAFAEFEERSRKTERARGIYLYGLERLPAGPAEVLRRDYQAFERRCG